MKPNIDNGERVSMLCENVTDEINRFPKIIPICLNNPICMIFIGVVVTKINEKVCYELEFDCV